jgi:hypothetical protein
LKIEWERWEIVVGWIGKKGRPIGWIGEKSGGGEVDRGGGGEVQDELPL